MNARKTLISDHARLQLGRRGLDEAVVLEVAQSPEQIVQLGPGRQVRQSRRRLASDGKDYLVRVIVDTGTDHDSIVTAYRSSKIEKYWRGS